MMLRGIIGALAILSAPASARPVRCAWTQKVQCDADASCKALRPVTWGVLDRAAKTYSRCDRAGCDTYPATLRQSGAYSIVDLPGRGAFAKVAQDGTATEVATLGASVIVSHGRCR
jgi:hypothetical protein